MATCEERMNLAVLGHVDHGKSTVVGRLLADTGTLPDGKLEQIREKCRRTGKRFEYSFLLDALADEQSQGITIEAARVHFQSPRRRYLILDVPGHVDFLRNMVTGASHAEAALLVLDAEEGVRENSRRHGLLARLVGVDPLLVLVNKMDRVGWSRERFEALAAEYREFLESLQIPVGAILPVSGLEGDNLARPSAHMPWYDGPTVLQALDALEGPASGRDEPFRMPVQDVYKFTRYGDSRRIVVGTVASGTLAVGDEVVFYPSARRSRVHSFETLAGPAPTEVGAGQAVGFTLDEQVYVSRGEIATRPCDPRPHVSRKFLSSLFWLGREPLEPGRDYTLKLATASVPARVVEISRVLEGATLEPTPDPTCVRRHGVAECVLKTQKALAFDEIDRLGETGRFVLVDGYRIAGGGIIRKALEDPLDSAWEERFVRSQNWIPSRVSPVQRAERYGQRPTLVLITGPAASDRKALGQALEASLFAEGRVVYFLGIGSLLHGLGADMEGQGDRGREAVRRLAEVANLMLGAGLLVLASAADLDQADLDLVQVLVGADQVKTVVLGEAPASDLAWDLHLPNAGDLASAVERVKGMLADSGVLWRPA